MIILEYLINVLLKLLPINIQPTMINQTNKEIPFLNLIFFKYSFEIGHSMKLKNLPYSNRLIGFSKNTINEIYHIVCYRIILTFFFIFSFFIVNFRLIDFLTFVLIVFSLMKYICECLFK